MRVAGTYAPFVFAVVNACALSLGPNFESERADDRDANLSKHSRVAAPESVMGATEAHDTGSLWPRSNKWLRTGAFLSDGETQAGGEAYANRMKHGSDGNRLGNGARFRFVSAMESEFPQGKGSEIPASERHFYEDTWFLLASAVVVALGSVAVLWVRERQHRIRLRLVSAERARLAREMHDTLLQGFAGAIYQVEAARRGLGNGPAAALLDCALLRADQALTEARQTLTFIRLSSLENRSLPEALKTAGKQILDGCPSSFCLEVKGLPREYAYRIQHNLFVLAREAITNAVRHAEARSISVTFAYSTSGLVMMIRDDGKGFVLGQPVPGGRLGLVSMRERANDIGAELSVKTAPGQGTTIEVRLPRFRESRATASVGFRPSP